MGELIKITRAKKIKYRIKRNLGFKNKDSSLEFIYNALFFGFFIGMISVMLPIMILSAILSFPLFPFLRGLENNINREKKEEKNITPVALRLIR